uniref:Uncharacterized protein n=1 Tax=Strigamia maritima TaxID=126957 RepID=T1IP09_STRMM
MEVIDHKEKCDLLRSYFQRVNPNSIPCTYKSNFEASAIQTLLSSEIIHGNGNVEVTENEITPLSKVEFGPWRTCTPNKSSDKTSVKTHHNDRSKKLSRNIPIQMPNPRKTNFVRPMSDGNSPSSVRTRLTNKTIRGHKSLLDDSVKVSNVPIQFPYQYNDDYKQYIENYRRSYTQCKLLEANQARPAAARIGLRAYDFRCGMRGGGGKAESMPYKQLNSGRAISLKTITLQVPQAAESDFVTSNVSSFVWPKSSPDMNSRLR